MKTEEILEKLDNGASAESSNTEFGDDAKRNIGRIARIGAAGGARSYVDPFADQQPPVERRVGVEQPGPDGNPTLIGVGGYEALQPLQLEGVDRILDGFLTAKHRGFLLADTMGSGKTMQAFATAKYMIEEAAKAGRAANILMLFPRTVLGSQSITQAQEMLGLGEEVPLLDGVTYNDLIEQVAHSNLSRAAKLRHDFNAYDLVVMDEAHNAKNPSSNRAELFIQLARDAKHVLLMSGTPSDKPSGTRYLVSSLSEDTELEELGVGIEKGVQGQSTYALAVSVPEFLKRVTGWITTLVGRGQYLRRVRKLNVNIGVKRILIDNPALLAFLDAMEPEFARP